MTIDPKYSREALQSVIVMLNTLRKDGLCYTQYGVGVHELDQVVDFLTEHLDDGDVASQNT